MFKKGLLAAFIFYVCVALAEGVARAVFGVEHSLLEMFWAVVLRPVSMMFYNCGHALTQMRLEEFVFAFWDTAMVMLRLIMIPYDFMSGVAGIGFTEFHIKYFPSWETCGKMLGAALAMLAFFGIMMHEPYDCGTGDARTKKSSSNTCKERSVLDGAV
jgi:hypothetical protein